MKNRYLLTMISVVCVAALAACGNSEPVAMNQPPAEAPAPPPPQPSTPATPAETFVSGQLAEIDPSAMTLVLKDTKGTEQKFTFTPTTKITGIASAKDIGRQEGRNATIRYVEHDNLKSAVQIHVELGS